MIPFIERMNPIDARGAHRSRSPWLLTLFLAILTATAILPSSPVMAEDAVIQKAFASPHDAVAALVRAVQEDDDGELLAILGTGSEDLISSGDKIIDRTGRERFLQAFEAKNHIRLTSEDQAELIVGIRNYPFPIPLVRQEDAWRFDTHAGLDEILNRRIGRNELHTIEVMHAYTDAQREYANKKRNGGSPEFARRFRSTAGSTDGLYWEVLDGSEESPFGPLIARASEEGYAGNLDEDVREPFHGYYFKILTAQGRHADGGAFEYVVNGRMILGFALLAYPAKYGTSGIMSFIVNQEGNIYEKDLGKDTTTAALAMNRFDPDGTWRRYEADPR